MGTEVGSCLMKTQSWALALFSRLALRSIFIHDSLSLYPSFCIFSGSLVAQSLKKKHVVRSWKKVQKCSIAPETTVVRSF